MSPDSLIPPWQNINPLAGADIFQRGFSTGAGIVDSAVASKQRQAEISLEKERLSKEEQQMAVNQELQKQQAAMGVQATARRYQAQEGYQRDYNSNLAVGMTPAAAAASAWVKWAPLMGSSFTGIGTDIGQLLRTGAGGGAGARAPMTAPSMIPGAAPRNYAPMPSRIEATPIYEPGTDSIIGNTVGGKYYPVPRTPTKTGRQYFNAVDTDKLADLHQRMKDIQTAMAKQSPNNPEFMTNKRTMASYQSQIDAIYAKYSDDQRPSATTPAPAPDITYDAPPSVRPQAAPPVPVSQPAVNPNLRPPTPNSWMPPEGTTAGGVKYRLVIPNVSPPPATGASAPALDHMLHQRFPPPPVPLPPHQSDEVTDESGDVGASESAWRARDLNQDELDNWSSAYSTISKEDLKKRVDQWKKLAEWYDTEPSKRGPKPPKPPFIWDHPLM